MNRAPVPIQVQRRAAAATLDTSLLAQLRHEQGRDIRLVALVLGAGLLTGLTALLHSLS